ncbi:pyridoxal phosphate-dependent transferase [Parachaetomium inaequale]|uniref:Pyridoxal phosphate-dependent transferase n=1 Tax=Parachaetomium inaequale TaxID=2588326 RepID=A0AAN6SN89_9PEZI|nr:pyridoxal phosphate-dependent transferase [Parachaetomium inaequale]
MSLFDQVPTVPLDGTFALMEACRVDAHELKVNLTPGIYRDENAKTWVLPSVKQARAALLADQSLNHDISPQLGYPQLLSAARQLVFKDTLDGRFITSMQTISGTGANHFIASLLSSHLRPRTVWVPNPTWDNHREIWRHVDPGIEQRNYPYYDHETCGIDGDALLSTLKEQANTGDAIILHACAHNPTGVDPSPELWEGIAQMCEEKGIFPIFDLAYQGFATGDADNDASAVRHFTTRSSSGNSSTLEFAVAQSFSKNFGLYSERVGALHVVARTRDGAARVEGMLKRISRAEITSTPAFGARIVAAVLHDPVLKAQWRQDLRTMNGRLGDMRKRLYDGLTRRNTPGSWGHILTDIGMFSMTGLSPEKVAVLKDRFHVYLLPNGRLSVTGLTEGNVEYVAESIYQVVKH